MARDHTFSIEDFFLSKPEHIFAYFAILSYGTPTPLVNDTPTKTRSATLEFAKKSYYHFSQIVSYLEMNKAMVGI